MKIYPKIAGFNYSDEMKKRIQKSEGLEIQFFDQNGITSEFDFVTEVIENKRIYPQLKEIIIHPPLSDYNIELLFLKDENIIKNQFENLVKLSDMLDIHICFIYHTGITVDQYISTGLDKRFMNLLKILEGKKVTILIENLYMLLDEKEECTPIEVCKYINHPNLMSCIDTTHLHCKANILKKDFYQMIDKELNADDCKKYVKQIHFASVLNNDGYRLKNTHGRMHKSFESLKSEYDWLCKKNMGDKTFISEVSEEDYFFRKDQLEEIRMMEML